MSSDDASDSGTTLVELMVVLAIISILAVTAIPFAEATHQRRAELELRETLRTTRASIDAFHEDWLAGRIDPDDEDVVSEAGYPVSLEVLVSGVELDTDPPEDRRYLRRLPRNPFDGGWLLRGYAQDRGAVEWDGEDVYDLAPATDRTALDGSQISDW